MKKVFTIILLLNSLVSFSQVGINTTTPNATLEVVGDVKIDSSLFLENPSQFYQIKNSDLLINTTANNIIQYDIALSKYGPINYAQFIFRNTSTHGLEAYNTKISVDKYILTIQGFYFKAAGGNTNVLLGSTLDNNNIEGLQFYAYPNTTTNTWFIKAVVNNSTFRSGPGYGEKPIDIFLNVIIYRRGFIAKTIPDRTVNMSNLETGTTTVPTGF